MNINCNGTLVDLSYPKVMGILNLTPDSFYDGGSYNSDKDLLQKVEQMLIAGATFIDIGGYSTRPNASEVTESEELQRVIPAIQKIKKYFPDALLSIDTFRSRVARESVANGCCMINDISAGNLDNQMMPVVAKLQVPYIMMHMRGTPQTMTQHATYEDMMKEILFYFSEKVAQARSFGINDLILDAGFGFAKTIEQNFELLSKLELLQMLELPILTGISRKSMIYKTLNTGSENALNGTTVLNTIALQKQTNILRVHDVKEAAECITLLEKLNQIK